METLQPREEPECGKAVPATPVFMVRGGAGDVTVGRTAAQAGRSQATAGRGGGRASGI